jgi:glycosyltransferase involved in cell wall biosynthesis
LNKNKISIIIPVYNAARHLEQCIRSVLAQTLEDIEVVVINDGSTDDSLAIIRDFEKRDKRVILVDSANEGVSAARNKGMAVSKGEFIGFVDSDDWIEPTMYEKLYQNAKNSEADLAICNVNIIDENNISAIRLALGNLTLYISENRIKELVNLIRFKYDYSNWNKIYSQKIVKENQLLFDESIKVYEDLLFNCYYFQYSQKATVINEGLYHYRVHSSSVMNSTNFDTITQYNKLYEKFNSFCIAKGLENELNIFNAEMRRSFYFAVIPKLFKQKTYKESSILKRIKLFADDLHKADRRLFAYDKNELQGIYGIKKRMLKDGRFFLFSLISSIRN